MHLYDLGRTLTHRWPLTLTAIAISVGLGFAAFTVVPPTYEATANVVLLPPDTTVGPGGNPYLNLGGLDQAVDVLTRAMTSDSAHDQVTAAAGPGTFEVLPDWTTSGPILVVTAQGRTRTATQSTLAAVLDLAPATLVNLQTTLNVPRDSQITSMVLTADDEPSSVLKTRLRAVAAVGIVGLVAGGLLIGLLDGILTTRASRTTSPSNRRPDESDASEESDTGGGDTDEFRFAPEHELMARDASAGQLTGSIRRASRD